LSFIVFDVIAAKLAGLVCGCNLLCTPHIMAPDHHGPNQEGVNANYGEQNITNSTMYFSSGGMCPTPLPVD
jgi:hypothetical protein